MKKLPIIVYLSLAVLLVSIGSAEMFVPGKYRGYFYIDRWKQSVFFEGPSHLFVSRDLAIELEPRKGKPLEINVTKFHRMGNPGGVILQEVSSIRQLEESEVSITIESKEKRISKGDSLDIAITISNKSKNTVKLAPRHQHVITASKQYVRSLEGLDYYDNSIDSIDTGETLSVACHMIRLPWNPKEYVSNSKNARIGKRTPTGGDPGIFYPVLIDTEGFVRTNFSLSKELEPGEYEVFVTCFPADSKRQLATVSNRLKFDVKK